MQNSSHKFRESMALIFQKFHIGFTCDIDMHAFGPPEIWRFTLWILTVSKVLMIHQQFLILRKKKMHCFITFPMQDQNKKQKSILCFMIFANQHEWLTLWKNVCCVCTLHYPILRWKFRHIYLTSYLHEDIRYLSVQHNFFGHMADQLIITV